MFTQPRNNALTCLAEPVLFVLLPLLLPPALSRPPASTNSPAPSTHTHTYTPNNYAANFIQKCGKPGNKIYEVCADQRINDYITKLKNNYDVLNAIHHNLYLGTTTLRQFRDKRLMVSR